MAGLPKSVNTDTPIDSNYLQYLNSLSSGGNTTNITSSNDSIKQYVKTKNGIFNGAFGSISQTLTISSGILDLTANSTGAVVVRRTVYVIPETGATDTLDGIELNGYELPNQELILITTTGDTVTIAHNATTSGTQKPFFCPGDTSYILAPNEAVTLIHDVANSVWIVTGRSITSSADNLGNHTATTNLNMSGNQIQQITTAFFNGDIDNANSIAGNTGGLDYNVDDTDEIHDFKVDGVSKFTIGNTQINMIADLSMSSKVIYLDSDIDSTISAVTDDIINIETGGSVRLSISNTTTLASGNLSTLGNLQVDGNALFNGDITLGSSSADKITFNADTENDITPNVDNVDKLGATLRAYSYTWVKSGSGIVEGYATGFMPTPVANSGILFCVPTAGGKTELRVTFQTGVSQLIATEP
jgi:hypothetical protein